MGTLSDCCLMRSVHWLVAPLVLYVWVAWTPEAYAAGRAYVSNEDGESVSVIDTGTDQVVATIQVGKRPRGLKLNADGSLLYVAVSGLPKCPPTVPDAQCAKLQRDMEADGIARLDTATLKLDRKSVV